MKIPISVVHGLLKLFERNADGAAAPMSRAEFLRGSVGKEVSRIRPPWALAEEEFLSRCNGCLVCRESCPEKIIVEGGAGLPEIDFAAGSCSFCGACVAGCPEGALVRTGERSAPWQLAVAIAPDCLAAGKTICRSCREQCPTGALAFSARTGGSAVPVVSREECTGCGACVGVCPVAAITVAPSLAGRQPNLKGES